jgi:DNA (cytosine-5)-methyltransferase 1
MRHTFACDKEDDALASYLKLTGHVPTKADLSVSTVGSLLGGFKGLIWMSPPCQPFSGMTPNENDVRVDLFRKVVKEVVERYYDSWVVLENVPNIIRFSAVTEAMDWVYKSRNIYFDEHRLKRFVIDCSAFGVPQQRKRLFWIIPPKGKPVPNIPQSSMPAKTFRDVIGGDFRDHDPEHWKLIRGERAILSTKRRASYAPENRWEDIPTTVLAAKRVYMHSGRFTHPQHKRRLTVGECMAIQGLPLVKLCGNMESRYRQTGNAVPPLVAKAVGKLILTVS